MHLMKEAIIDKYENEWLWVVLCLVQSKGNIYDSVTIIHTEDDVMRLINELEAEGYLSLDGENRRVALTPAGTELYNALLRKLKKRGLYRYMIPNIDKRIISKRPEYNLYIPSKENAKKLL